MPGRVSCHPGEEAEPCTVPAAAALPDALCPMQGCRGHSRQWSPCFITANFRPLIKPISDADSANACLRQPLPRELAAGFPKAQCRHGHAGYKGQQMPHAARLSRLELRPVLQTGHSDSWKFAQSTASWSHIHITVPRRGVLVFGRAPSARDLLRSPSLDAGGCSGRPLAGSCTRQVLAPLETASDHRCMHTPSAGLASATQLLVPEASVVKTSDHCPVIR